MSGLPARVGTRIREYEILEVVGRGGMGEVYRARHVYLDEQRAIKVIHAQFATQKGFLDRFIREARILSKLRDPHLVQLFEFGTLEEKTFFMVMEYIRGESVLARMRKKGRLGTKDSIRIIREAAMGLDAAHRKGIVHRDISPDNLLLVLDEQGREITKVIDFGIAKPLLEAASSATATNVFMGKLEYCSPEQCGLLADGETIDARADIYSLGVTFYHMLTGQPPFRATTPQAYILKHATEAPASPSSLMPSTALSEDLEKIIMKMLSKNRNARQASMRELIVELDQVVLSSGEPTTMVVPMKETGPTLALNPATPVKATQVTSETQASKRTDARASEAVALARREFQNGSFDAAITRLGAFLPPHPLVSQALAELKTEREAGLARGRQLEEKQRADQERRAREAIDLARRESSEGKHEAAISRLQAFQPPMTLIQQALVELKGRKETAVQRQQEEERQRAELERRGREVIDIARQEFADGKPDAAIHRLESFQPPITAVSRVLVDLQAQRDAIAARKRQEEERQKAELEKRGQDAVDQSRREFAAGQHDAAIARLQRFEPAALVAEVLAELQDEKEAIEVRTREEEDRRRADLERRARNAVDLAHSDFGRGRQDAAITRLRSFEPPHPLVAGALDELQARKEQAEAQRRAEEERRQAEAARAAEEAVASARQEFAAGQHDAALSRLQSVKHPAATRALGELREEKKALDASRKEEERKRAELDRRARDVADQSRKDFRKGRREGALARLAAFQPAHPVTTSALEELKAQAREADEKEEESRRREAEARRRQEEERLSAAQEAADATQAVPRPAFTDPGRTAEIPTPVSAPSGNRTMFIGGGIVVILVVAVGLVLFLSQRGATPIPSPIPSVAPSARPSGTPLPPPVTPEPGRPRPSEADLLGVSKLLDGHHYAEASQRATALLQAAPGNPDAQRLLDRAREGLQKLTTLKQEAQAAYARQQYSEAAKAVASLLDLAPDDAEARQLGQQVDAAQKRQVDTGSFRLQDAKSAADRVRAPELAAGDYDRATRAQKQATELVGAKRYSEALVAIQDAEAAFRAAESRARSTPIKLPELPRASLAPSAPPTVDTGQLAQKQMEEARAAMEQAKSAAGAPDRRAAAQEATARELAQAGKPGEAAQAYSRAAVLYQSGRADRQGILDALHKYQEAIGAKDLNGLKAVWPTLPERQIREGFSAVRSQRVDLTPGEVHVEGDSASVTCDRRDEVVGVSGEKVQNHITSNFNLQRRAGAWTITSIN